MTKHRGLHAFLFTMMIPPVVVAANAEAGYCIGNPRTDYNKSRCRLLDQVECQSAIACYWINIYPPPQKDEDASQDDEDFTRKESFVLVAVCFAGAWIRLWLGKKCRKACYGAPATSVAPAVSVTSTVSTVSATEPEFDLEDLSPFPTHTFMPSAGEPSVRTGFLYDEKTENDHNSTAGTDTSKTCNIEGQWWELTQQELIDHSGTSANDQSSGEKMTQASRGLPEQPQGEDGQKTSSNGDYAADAKSKKGAKRRPAEKFANRRSFLDDSATTQTIPTIRTKEETGTSTTASDQKKTAMPCLIKPKAFNVEKIGLVGKGDFIIGARVEDTRLGQGNILWLSLVCRNHTTCDIEKIIIRLKEEYHWTAKNVGDPEDSTTTLVEQSEQELSPSVVGWKAKSHRSEDIEALNSKKARECTNWGIYRDLISNNHKIALNIPWKARDSFTGVNEKVSHYVEIQVKTLFSSSAHTRPTIQIPIRIGNTMTPPLDSHMAVNDEVGGVAVIKRKPFRSLQLELPPSVRKSLVVAPKENMILGRQAGLLNTQDSSFDAGASATSTSKEQPSGETAVEKEEGKKMTQSLRKLPEQSQVESCQKTRLNGVEAAHAKSKKGAGKEKYPAPVEGVVGKKHCPASKKTNYKGKTPATKKNSQSPPSTNPRSKLSRDAKSKKVTNRGEVAAKKKTSPAIKKKTQSPPSTNPKRKREKTIAGDNTQCPTTRSA